MCFTIQKSRQDNLSVVALAEKTVVNELWFWAPGGGWETLDKEHPPLGWELDWWGSRGKQKIGFMGLRTGQQKKGNSGPKR